MAISDLNDLRFFVAVVSAGGFSAAARVLDLPKSSLSRRVATLEAELGVRLIERSTRSVRVTEIGREIFRHAQAALVEAETIEEAVSRLKTEPQGLVRISCPPGADKRIAESLPEFLAHYPKLRIQMLVTTRRINLIEEAIDIAVRARERLDTDADFQVKIIGRTKANLVASPRLLELLGRPKTLDDIERFPSLGFGEMPGDDKWILIGPDTEERAIPHTPRFVTTNLDIMQQCAIAGVGIALLPEFNYRGDVSDGLLEVILPEWGGRETIAHLVYTSRRGLLPSVRATIDFVAAALDLKALSKN